MATINVTVYDSTENKRVPVELPDDAPCNKIIVVLIQKLRLPPTVRTAPRSAINSTTRIPAARFKITRRSPRPQ